MEEFFSNSLVLILIGIFIGIFIYNKYLNVLDSLYIDKKYKSPLFELEKRGMGIYTFLYRQGDFVVLRFDTDSFIYLDLYKHSVSVYEGKNFLFAAHPSLKIEFELFYNKLIHKFNKEIYDDVIVVNNIVYSKNIFSTDTIENLEDINKEKAIYNKNNEFSINDILDKINESGIDSLTDKEKDYLYRQGDNETPEK